MFLFPSYSLLLHMLMMPISCDRQQVYLPGYHWQFNISNLPVTDVYSTNCDYFEHFWYFKLLPMIHNNSSYHLQPINYDLRINGINCTQTTNPLHRAIETCNINETNNQQNHSELSQSNAQCHGHQHFVYYRDSKAVQAAQWSFGIENNDNTICSSMIQHVLLYDLSNYSDTNSNYLKNQLLNFDQFLTKTDYSVMNINYTEYGEYNYTNSTELLILASSSIVFYLNSIGNNQYSVLHSRCLTSITLKFNPIHWANENQCAWLTYTSNISISKPVKKEYHTSLKSVYLNVYTL